MKTRQVFSTPDLSAAQAAIAAARHAGVPDEAIALIARADIEMDSIPEERLDASSDTLPALLRGAATGGAIGVVGGLVAVAIPAIGVTVAGAGLVALIGAIVGGWSSALLGASVPNSVRRHFEAEIEQGRILVVIDDEHAHEPQVRAALLHAGATPLPFHQSSLLST